MRLVLNPTAYISSASCVAEPRAQGEGVQMSKTKQFAEDLLGEDEFYRQLDEEMDRRGYEPVEI